jgi:hypothetical protein
MRAGGASPEDALNQDEETPLKLTILDFWSYDSMTKYSDSSMKRIAPVVRGPWLREKR